MMMSLMTMMKMMMMMMMMMFLNPFEKLLKVGLVSCSWLRQVED
jgi:hypothetical protein